MAAFDGVGWMYCTRSECPLPANIYSNGAQQLLRFKHGPDVNFVNQWY